MEKERDREKRQIVFLQTFSKLSACRTDFRVNDFDCNPADSGLDLVCFECFANIVKSFLSVIYTVRMARRRGALPALSLGLTNVPENGCARAALRCLAGCAAPRAPPSLFLLGCGSRAALCTVKSDVNLAHSARPV